MRRACAPPQTHCTLVLACWQVREALDKLNEAVTFIVRGFKLLGSDIALSARLFGRAAVGECCR